MSKSKDKNGKNKNNGNAAENKNRTEGITNKADGKSKPGVSQDNYPRSNPMNTR